MCCPCVCATINIVFKEIFNKLGEKHFTPNTNFVFRNCTALNIKS